MQSRRDRAAPAPGRIFPGAWPRRMRSIGGPTASREALSWTAPDLLTGTPRTCRRLAGLRLGPARTRCRMRLRLASSSVVLPRSARRPGAKEIAMRRLCVMGMVLAFAVGCSQAAPTAAPADTAKPAAKLGVRPQGDTDIQPDLSQVPPEVQKVFDHIDENIDEHVENLQKWIQQPSISNSGEGIPEIGRDGEGILRRARVPADAGLRRRRHRVRLARAIPSSTPSATRAREKTLADLLDVRHDAGDAAGRVDRAALRRRGLSSRRRTRKC